MKMNSRQKNKSTRFLFWLGVIFALIFISRIGFPFIAGIAGPIFSIRGWISGYSIILKDKQVLEDKNRLLEEKVTMLQAQLVTGHNVVDEGMSFSRIIARPPQSFYGTLLIEANDTVEVGDNVFAHKRIFIGTVEEVSFGVAKVVLASTPGHISYLYCERSGVPVTLEGIGGGNLISRVPYGTDIENNDVLIDFSTGAVVAEIEDIESIESDAFIKMRARIPVNIFELNGVYTTRPTNEDIEI